MCLSEVRGGRPATAAAVATLSLGIRGGLVLGLGGGRSPQLRRWPDWRGGLGAVIVPA